MLDREYWESDLCAVLEELREEIHGHMAITEELTNKARGNNRSYLEAANGEWVVGGAGQLGTKDGHLDL